MAYIKSICYSGFREGQHPGFHRYPSVEQIREDLHILAKDGYKQIRLYDPSLHAIRVCEVIKEDKLDLKVMLGMGIAGEVYNPNVGWGLPIPQEILNENIPKNNQVLKDAIKLANTYPNIINYVACGNENTSDWNPNLVSIERLRYFLVELKKHIKQPVTFCEGVYFWNHQTAALKNDVDIISIHIYPFWTRTRFIEAVSETIKLYNDTQEKFKDKTIFITECGWPTSSDQPNDYTNLENHKKYVKEIDAWAMEKGITVYFFEAFDEPWKGGNDPLEAEKNWGLYNVERTLK